MCGNMFGVKRYVHFVSSLREMILAMMELETCLVILPYPDCVTTKKGRPFSNNCSMLSSVTWCKIYVDKLWVGDGTPTFVKIFVGHNIQVAAFNSLELAQKADNFECAVCVCITQSSKVKVVEAGYLLSSSKSTNYTH